MRRNNSNERKALLTDGIVGETPEGFAMACTCHRVPEVCTPHNADAEQRWRMAIAVRRAIAAGVMPEVSGALQ